MTRSDYQPPLPPLLEGGLRVESGEKSSGSSEVEALFPHTFGQSFVSFSSAEPSVKPLNVGVVLSGGQAPGGHNVICGLFDALPPGSLLVGFLGGPGGIVENKRQELTSELLAPYRNSGGFDLIGSGRTKIESKKQLAASLSATQDLDGLVIIGGDDSNTNAAVLAEYFLEHGSKTKVVGVPKTIDGDLKNEWIATPFGFDTACKVYSQMIGNVARDALSAKKYYHFIRLMGRSASHIALECALQTHPNVVLIGEEVAKRGETLEQIVDRLTTVIEKRAAMGKHFGVILIPEGLIEFIPEIRTLIAELSEGHELVGEVKKTFDYLPEAIQEQLMLDRDPHGNVKVSQIETERLLIELVLRKRIINPIAHFFGYEGRASYPSNFDAAYCQALGHVAAALIAGGCTGYMCGLRNLKEPTEKWQPIGLPITQLMHVERRHGKSKPVIKKSLVDLEGKAFRALATGRSHWELEDSYGYALPIQFEGEEAEALTKTLEAEG